jgi:hypothetical protein
MEWLPPGSHVPHGRLQVAAALHGPFKAPFRYIRVHPCPISGRIAVTRSREIIVLPFLSVFCHPIVVSHNPVLQPILANWPGFAGLLGILVFFKILASPSFKGRLGEWMVNRGLRRLDPSRYRHFDDIYLPHPAEAGTTQIDHAVVSPFGIFVIETKNYRGWIFGSEKQREWTQQIHRRKVCFQNPLHQNRLHVRALMRFLDLPEDRFHPVVLFIGNSELKTRMPDNVLNRGLVPWIKRHVEVRLEPDSTEKAIACLEHLQRSTDRRTAAREHIAALRMRHVRSHS